MKQWSLAIIVAAMGSLDALGASVVFDPPSISIDSNGADTTAMFQVSVSSELFEEVTAARIIFGSDNLRVVSLILDEAFRASFDQIFNEDAGTSVYPSAINLDALNLVLTGVPMLQVPGDTPVLIGMLTVDAAGLAAGEYRVGIDFERDGASKLVFVDEPSAQDRLAGFATVTVTGDDAPPPPPPPPPADTDGDGVADPDDAFPNDPTETSDRDADGVGDNADAFPDDPAESVDTDGDGTGDNADTDSDNDGVMDVDDSFPLDETESVDGDNDGVGDNGDAFPDDPAESTDTDGDGIGNNADTDDDNDGVADVEDALPLDPNETRDSDGDGIGDNADAGGDNANTGPRAGGGFCAMGVLPAIFVTFLGLFTLRRSTTRPIKRRGWGGKRR